MKMIMCYRDKNIRRQIARWFREEYPNCSIEGFGDCLLAAKAVYADVDTNEAVDAVVTGIEGIKLIPMLRKTGQSFSVVILADNSLHEKEALAAGADAYVSRPFRKEALYAAVEGRYVAP